MSDPSELLAVCADLIRLIEGVGCRDWRDQNGQRIKDTNEWVRAYVAINKAIAEERKAKAARPVAVPEVFPGTTDALASLSIKPKE